jgi:hypothetical protein
MKEDEDKTQPAANININVNPDKTPVYSVDTFIIGSNDNLVSFNFAQAVLGTNQQHIVARVSLTSGQAKEFLEKLNDHIQKFEV